MAASYILGHGPATIVTDATTGTVSVVPGIPITETTPPQAALLASLVTDTDDFYAPTVTALAPATLAPPLVSDSDAVYAADADLPHAPHNTQQTLLTSVTPTEIVAL